MAAMRHSVSSTIIMPKDSPRIKIENTRALGAEVVLYDRATEDRSIIEEKVNPKNHAFLLSPTMIIRL